MSVRVKTPVFILLGLLVLGAVAVPWTGGAHPGTVDAVAGAGPEPAQVPGDLVEQAPSAEGDEKTATQEEDRLTGSKAKGLSVLDSLLTSRPAPALSLHGPRELEFECPSTGDSTTTGAEGVKTYTVHSCPLRVYDTTGPGMGGFHSATGRVGVDVGFLLGDVDLVMHPGDPGQAAFFALHGHPAEDGRIQTARAAPSHTTFTTVNGGLSWDDQPTLDNPRHNAWHGEWATGTIDRDGRLYPVFLWSTDPDEDGVYESLVGVHWAGRPDEDSSVTRSYGSAQFLRPLGEEHLIETVEAVYLAPWDEADEEDLANESGDPEQAGELGDRAVVRNETDAIALVWFERPAQPGEDGPLPGRIDAMWHSTQQPEFQGTSVENRTIDREDTNWTFLREDERIGPCRGMSDPVVWERQIYVACIVARGYEERSRARIGDVDLLRIDPETGESHIVGWTGIDESESVRLAVTSDGYFAVMATRVKSENNVEVRVSMGWHGIQWGQRDLDIGEALHATLGRLPVRDAHVTGIALTEDEKTLMFVYKEWNRVEEPSPRAADQLPRLADYKKLVVGMSECTFPLGAAEFHMGELFDSHQYETWMNNSGLFNDRKDGLEYVRLPDGRERMMMAVNDYGAVQYAAIVPPVLDDDVPCNPGVPGVPIPAAAIPQAVGLGTGAGTIVGSVLGLVSLAMIAYLLAVKRKSPMASAVEDK